MNRFNLTFISLISTLLLLPTTAAFSIQPTSNRPNSILLASTQSTQQIRQIAQAVTVKVVNSKKGGSGVLIAKEKQTYTVVTNAHVVNVKGTYKIQTPDGKQHLAVIKYRGDSLTGNDLAVLQFQSKNNYRIVELSTTTKPQEDQEVYAAGFPYNSQQLTFNTGKISLLSSQPFMGGYQIGYTNKIQPGMSGGALLDREGKLIGINGLSEYPILNDTYTYQDGSQPSEELRQQFRQLSFAVPIQTLAKVAPQLAINSSQQPSDRLVTNTPSSSAKLTGLPAEIDKIAQQITVRIDARKPENGNGSGVIIARQGQTYYILTNYHVVANTDEYTVVTPDGKKYQIAARDIVKEDGLDAAILKFNNQQNYQVAILGKYNFSDDKKHWIFFSGFPASKGGKRQLNPGFHFSREGGSFEVKDNLYLSDGYELVYTNQSLPGMSGGALLDTQGRVIGIGGRPEGENVKDELEIYLGYALGVPITTISGLLSKAEITPKSLKIETTKPASLNESQANEILSQPTFNIEKPSKDADENYWLNYGNQLWRLAKHKEAVAALQQAIDKNDEFYQAYYVLGLVQQSQGKSEEAAATFRQVIQLRPDYYQAWRDRSSALAELKKYSDARQSIEKAIQLNSEYLKDFTLYVRKGNILTKLKSYTEAEAAYTEAINIKPNTLTYNNRGVFYFELKKYGAAEADFNQAIALNPQFAQGYNNRGIFHQRLQNYRAAEADFNQAIALNPQLAKAYSNRGFLHEELKNYRAAITDYAQAITLDPQLAEAHYNRGSLHYRLQNYLGAEADYNRAIALNPQFGKTYNNRGVLYQNLRSYQAAIADYTQAIALDPQLAEAYYNRGFLRYQLNNYQGAIADLQTAAEIFRQQGRIDDYQKIQGILEQVQSSLR
jgi:tetratricopeptide (TPR) repeat protein/S1-C subfamily serine protease